MALLFSNNASAELAAALTAGATTLYVEEGKGSYFPVISRVGDYFYVTLVGDSVMEIVKVTATEGDTFTIVRAQDNTEAAAFAIGDLIELRITAADFKDILTSPKLSDFFADSSKVNPIYSTDADTYSYWSGIRGGVYYYNRAGSLVNQPSQYGLLLHCAQLAFVFQLWKALPNGDLYYRSMSDTNERDEWTKLAKDADLTALAEQINTDLTTSINDLSTQVDDTFLKKSGGTMTGVLTTAKGTNAINSASDDSYLQVQGGNSNNGGGFITLRGVGQSTTPGGLNFGARNPADGTQVRSMSYTFENGLVENGNQVITAAGGTLTGALWLKTSDNKLTYLDDTTYGYKYMLIQAGEWDSGARIQLMRHDSPNDAGVLVLRGGTCDVRLKPDGTFSKDGKNVVLSVNGVNADSAGNVALGKSVYLTASWNSGSNWYRKYSDGWIEQGGTTQNVGSDSTVTVSCHTPFTTTNYNIVVSQKSSGTKTDSTGMVLVYPSATSSWYLHNGDNVSAPFMWYACGF